MMMQAVGRHRVGRLCPHAQTGEVVYQTGGGELTIGERGRLPHRGVVCHTGGGELNSGSGELIRGELISGILRLRVCCRALDQ